MARWIFYGKSEHYGQVFGGVKKRWGERSERFVAFPPNEWEGGGRGGVSSGAFLDKAPKAQKIILTQKQTKQHNRTLLLSDDDAKE